MTPHNSPWQEFHRNGEPIVGLSGDKEYFRSPEHIMGASHVWLWRKSGNDIEVLLQRRSEMKKIGQGIGTSLLLGTSMQVRPQLSRLFVRLRRRSA